MAFETGGNLHIVQLLRLPIESRSSYKYVSALEGAPSLIGSFKYAKLLIEYPTTLKSAD